MIRNLDRSNFQSNPFVTTSQGKREIVENYDFLTFSAFMKNVLMDRVGWKFQVIRRAGMSKSLVLENLESFGLQEEKLRPKTSDLSTIGRIQGWQIADLKKSIQIDFCPISDLCYRSNWSTKINKKSRKIRCLSSFFFFVFLEAKTSLVGLDKLTGNLGSIYWQTSEGPLLWNIMTYGAYSSLLER